MRENGLQVYISSRLTFVPKASGLSNRRTMQRIVNVNGDPGIYPYLPPPIIPTPSGKNRRDGTPLLISLPVPNCGGSRM